MKAMIETNRTSRVLTVVVILTMAAAAGYGQGLLAEGAVKLFNSLTSKLTAEQSLIHQASYSVHATKAAHREFNPEVIRSFSVEDVDITFEKDVKTEDWMTKSFAENVEEGYTVESWMTTPMNDNLEEAVTLEDWMATPMSENIESNPTPEAWMTTPLYTKIETTPEVESWMTTPLLENGASEEPIQLEEWMTELLR